MHAKAATPLGGLRLMEAAMEENIAASITHLSSARFREAAMEEHIAASLSHLFAAPLRGDPEVGTYGSRRPPL
jgi:hypothetical protein